MDPAAQRLSQWLSTFFLSPPATQCAAPSSQQRKAPRRLAPLELNLVCVGRKGLGKTTALDTLFGVSADTTGVVTHRTQLCHNDDQEAEIVLHVTDGPGFADDADAQGQVQKLLGSIRGGMREHAFAQKMLSHHHPDGAVRDPRTHLVLYFVPPGELPETDRKAIDTLLPYANVAVVAAKADSLVPEELVKYKEEISRQLDDSSARRRRRREGLGVTVDEDYMPFGIVMDDPRSCPVASPVFAVIGKERYYHGWGSRGTATPADSDMPHLREQILSLAGTDTLVSQTDMRFTDHFERGELRNSVLTAKATAIGAAAGTVLGMCIKQQISARLREAAGGRGLGDDGSSPAARIAARGRAGAGAGEVPGAPVVASMLFGAALGASYHSIFGKLD